MRDERMACDCYASRRQVLHKALDQIVAAIAERDARWQAATGLPTLEQVEAVSFAFASKEQP